MARAACGQREARKVPILGKILASLIVAMLALAQGGILNGWAAEKAHAETATSQDLVYRFAKIYHYVDGVRVSRLTESVLGVNGEVAFCMDPFTPFVAGTVASTDILTIVSQEQLTAMALRMHFIRDLYQDNPLSDNARIIVAQTAIWEILAPGHTYSVVSAEDGGTFPELTAAVREDAMEKARRFAAENASRYQGHGTLWINGDTQPVATLSCDLAVGTIDLSKRSSNPSASNGNGCYSIEGAVYGIFADPACTNRIGQLVTDANGYAKSEELHVGTYYVKEVNAPKGFELDATPHSVTVLPGQTSRVEGSSVYDAPLTRRGIASLGKHDAEIGWKPDLGDALGCATVAGAKYSVEHYGGLFTSVEEAASAGNPLARWEFLTNDEGCIDLSLPDDFLVDGTLYRDADGNAVFPLGTYVFRETAPSEGYLLSEEAFMVTVRQEGSEADMTGGFTKLDGRELIAAAEQVKRCDLSFNKVRESDMTRLGGIPFALTSETTGESHIIVTDENGHVDTSSSWNRHTFNTNGSDQALREDGSLDEEGLDASAGLWFGLSPDGEMTYANDSLGALLYDTYILEELPCSANAGLELVRMTGIIAKRNAVVIDLGTIDDKAAQLPAIDTVAYDAADMDKQVSPDEHAVVTDKVELAHLVPGRTYTLYGTIIDASTGLPALAAPDLDDEEGLCDEQQMSLREFWDDLACLLGVKQVQSLEGISYEIEPDQRLDADALAQYMADHADISSRMTVASMSFEADSSQMVTALDYEMDASQMEGDYVIYDLLAGDDGVMAVHADTENEDESFVVEQPEGESPGKGYFKTGGLFDGPWGASGMVASGTAIGAAFFAGRRFVGCWKHV